MGKLGEELKFKYEPILPQAPLDTKFHYFVDKEDGTKEIKIHTEGFKLIKTIEELKEYIEKCRGKLVGFDTETTGLSYGTDHIVGFSFSLDSYSGVYVPIRHQRREGTKRRVTKLDEDGNPILTKTGKVSTKIETTWEYFDCEDNLNPKEALDVLYEILTGASLVIMHNSEFDLNMLKFEGYDVTKINAFDNLILPYLFDPEASDLAGLKALEKRVLGRVVPEFKDVLGKDAETFAFVKPEDGYVYAVCDTCGLIGVYNVLYPKVRELLQRFRKPLNFNGKVYDVLQKDNKLVMAFVDYYGHTNILIDREKALKYKEGLEQEQKEVIKEIYDYFNCGMFNLSTSSNEFKEVMASKNVFTGSLTEKGEPSYSKSAAGDMKRNLNRLKDIMDNWRLVGFSDGVLTKDTRGYNLLQLIQTYGSQYFRISANINFATFRGKHNEDVDLVTFWSTVKKIYEDEKEKLRILSLVQKNNSLNKALSSYVDKLTQVDECKMKYRLKGTKSGRLSSGNGAKSDKRKNKYYIDLNAQNLTKPASAYFSAEKCNMNDPEGILGWKFTPLETEYAMEHLEDLYIVEGQDPKPTVRGCLYAPKGKVEHSFVTESYKVPNVAYEDGGEQPAFGVLFSDGNKLECTKSSVFKVNIKGRESYLTLPEIMKYKGEYLIQPAGVTIKGIKKLGSQRVYKQLDKQALHSGNTVTYSNVLVGKRYVVSLDYDAQEYKLMAILSQDSKMLENFAKGIDPHTASAYAIWGEENYNKAKRKKAKIFNFLNNYSGGAGTLSQQLDIPLKEAQEMIDKYNQTFHEMVAWKAQEIQNMYQNDCVVFNAFGRPRQFKGWAKLVDRAEHSQDYKSLKEKDDLMNAARRVKSALERRVSSHIIQGTAGDILRRVMLILYNRFFKKRDPYIDFLSTVHDEINYTIDVNTTVESIKELEGIMTFDILSKDLPITTSTDIGFTYGNMFPFVWEDETKTSLIPKRVHHA